MIEVVSVRSQSAGDESFVAEVSELINRAYDEAEVGLWRAPIARTSASEVAARIAAGDVVIGAVDGRLAGAVYTSPLDERTGWFGALAVDPRKAGHGLGRRLVEFCEQRAVHAGSTRMQLELLAPRLAHPHTTLLADWYRRLGYTEVDRAPLADVEPELAGFLLDVCEIVVCRKRLL